MKRIALITLVVALLTTGCGDDDKDSGTKPSANDGVMTPGEALKQAQEATGTSLPASAPTTQPGGGSGTTTTARAGGQAGATTTTPTSDPSVTMKLDRQCVRRGPLGDKQGLGVVSAPNDTIAWSTEYSDHTNELSNPEYKSGGSGYGKADGEGKYHTSWFVPKEAPLGEATLHTIAKGKLQPHLKFRVVGENDSC